jgi:tetratricopeptide (TPR) repeat protein
MPGRHPFIASSLATIGELQRRRGKLEEARATLQRALAVFRSSSQFSGHNPENECWILGSLAKLELKAGRHAEAEPLFVEAIRLREKLYGVEDIELAEVLEPYAELLRAIGREAEAGPIEIRARSIRDSLPEP